MVEAADLWKRDDVPHLRHLDRSRFGRVLVQRKMRSRPVVIREVRAQQSPQMRLIDNDDVIEKLSTNRSDQALDVRILPGRPGCRDQLGDAHVGNAFPKTPAEDRITVALKVAGRRVPGERLQDLQGRPLGCRVRGDVEVNDSATFEFQDHESHREPGTSP